MTKSHDVAFSLLSKQGFKISDNPIGDILEDTRLSVKYEDMIELSVVKYLKSVYGNKRLDDSGICLISNLIGKACQMIHNESLLGVVRDYDKEHTKLLMIDFGDLEEVKVDIDELVIVGQKR